MTTFLNLDISPGDDGEPASTPVEGAPPGTVTYTMRDPEAAGAAIDELLSARVEVTLYAPDLDRLPTLEPADLMALLELFDDGDGTSPSAPGRQAPGIAAGNLSDLS